MRLCPKCGAESDIHDSRPRDGGLIARRRRCVSCGERWGTMEISLHEFRQFQKFESSLLRLRDEIDVVVRSITEASP